VDSSNSQSYLVDLVHNGGLIFRRTTVWLVRIWTGCKI